MATERTPMYCVDCGQATYDAKYCDDCRCLVCPNSPKYCTCPRCITETDARVDMYGNCWNPVLPGRRVCYDHFCPICLKEHLHVVSFNQYCRGCYKFKFVSTCRSCGQFSNLSSNFNCRFCECMYCDNMHCIVHKCLLCDKLISFNDPDLKYCDDHACQRCVYKPAVNGRFCAKCSVNRTVGTHTKRAN